MHVSPSDVLVSDLRSRSHGLNFQLFQCHAATIGKLFINVPATKQVNLILANLTQ